MKTLFVAFSHSLTTSQIEGFKSQYGTDFTIRTLREVAPELQEMMSNIPATTSLQDIQELAKKIVAEAVKVDTTHFYCVGEPTLTLWANLYASQTIEFWIDNPNTDWDSEEDFSLPNSIVIAGKPKALTCIQSTTERKAVEQIQPDGSVTKTNTFSHVIWREMF